MAAFAKCLPKVKPADVSETEYGLVGEPTVDMERISLFDDPTTHGVDEEVEAALQMMPDGPKRTVLYAKANTPGAGTLSGGYQGNSIYFYAMVKTVETECFVCMPTALALVCLVGQVLILNGILFKNFVASVPNIVSWHDLAVLQGLNEEKIGFVVGLVISPMILLAKLVANGEFMDVAVFAAQGHPDAQYSVGHCYRTGEGVDCNPFINISFINKSIPS